MCGLSLGQNFFIFIQLLKKIDEIVEGHRPLEYWVCRYLAITSFYIIDCQFEIHSKPLHNFQIHHHHQEEEVAFHPQPG